VILALVGHHASPHRFDFPDYQALVEHRQNHANGNLGLWVATGDHAWIEGFGEHIYRVELAGRMRDITVGKLQRLPREAPWYQMRRDQLIAEGITCLRVIESDGRSDMAIVVDFDAISRFERIDGRDLQISLPARAPTIGITTDYSP
jgi:hypothetical protein